MTHPNSATYWLPRVEAAGLPTPLTVTVPYDHRALVGMIEDRIDTPEWPRLVSAVEGALVRLGYPAFLRTDLASAKHDGPKAYRLDNAGAVPRAVTHTVADSETKFWLTGPAPSVLLIRQWLDLDAPFAAFGGHGRAHQSLAHHRRQPS